MSTTTLVPVCNASVSCSLSKQSHLCRKQFLGVGRKVWDQGVAQSLNGQKRRLSNRFDIVAATKGSTESSKSEDTLPSWARPDADEPPPWAREEGKTNGSQQGFEVPFGVYLLASAVTAIAAIGSIFEYVNQRPIFGVVNSDSIFYAPILGFFAITGIPTSAFLWFKSVQVANREAEEQDRRDGFL